MGSNRGNTSASASIYKNPFEVGKDQLMRQLFEFPARIAAFVQSQRNDRHCEGVESPFIALADKLKARDEMGARLFVCPEKIGCGNETILKGLPRKDSSQSSVKDADVGNFMVEKASASGLKVTKPKSAISGTITYSRRKRKLKEQSGDCGDGESVAAKEVVTLSLPAVESSWKRHDATGFIIEAIRTLRHTRLGNSQKLFELLSRSDFPVDKCSFLQELIRQAYWYNKAGVAEQLVQYQNETCQVSSVLK